MLAYAVGHIKAVALNLVWLRFLFYTRKFLRISYKTKSAPLWMRSSRTRNLLLRNTARALAFREQNAFLLNNKQHITVDNSYMLLYTVCERRKNLLQKVLVSALRRREAPGKEIDMQIVINGSSMVPVYEQLMDNIKQQIISGELNEGDALPSVRKLANELKISALTVKKAYDRLEEEGFVVTVHGKGSFVTGTDMALAVEARKKSIEEEFAVSVERARALGLKDDDIREILEIILGE